MAFTTSNVSVSVFGNMKVQVGQWTASAADAAGTIKFDGGQVWLASFEDQGTGAGPTEEVPYSTSGGGPITLTVYPHNPVTTGRYIIIGS